MKIGAQNLNKIGKNRTFFSYTFSLIRYQGTIEPLEIENMIAH